MKTSKEMLLETVSKEIQQDAVSAPSTLQTQGRSSLDHWSPAILLERAAYLRKMAQYGDGAASETLKDYSQHSAMLLVRNRDGEAEVHEGFADVFYVLEGRATLQTGGTVQGARIVAPGETRGDAIEGGRRQELRAGDIAHVPAGEPHRMLVPGDRTVACFVLKIQDEPKTNKEL
jgi:mannose-6-phosphate isomerase-like protein (cupin superfamily)